MSDESIGSVKAALMALPEKVDAGASPGAIAAADTWAQVATSFASLTQGTSMPNAEQVQSFLGQASVTATELVGYADAFHGLINDLVAPM